MRKQIAIRNILTPTSTFITMVSLFKTLSLLSLVILNLQEGSVNANDAYSRTACDASFNAPCSRFNTEVLARETAQQLSRDLLELFQTPSQVFEKVNNGEFNVDVGFYPFVFERSTAITMAHGGNPNFTGKTLAEIFDEMGIGFTDYEDLQRRFEDAADTPTGDWVSYLWRSSEEADVVPKTSFVASVTENYYVGFGFSQEQLPLKLPCSSDYDSWCSIDNGRSLLGKAQNRLAEAADVEMFEDALYDFSYDEEYSVSGGYHLFLYTEEGILKSDPYFSYFTGKSIAYVYEQVGGNPQDGIATFEAIKQAAETSGWIRFQWSDSIEEPFSEKVAQVITIEFQGNRYYLGSVFEFAMGQVVPAYSDLVFGTDEEEVIPEEEERPDCPGNNLPCSFGTTLLLTSHSFVHAVSSDDPQDEMFASVSYEPEFKYGGNYVFMHKYEKGECVAHGAAPHFVGLSIAQIFEKAGITWMSGDQLHESFRETAELGGGYVVYDWNLPSKDEGQVDMFFQKIAYIYKLTLGGNDFYGGVGVNHIRAPLEEGLDTGTKANGDMIPCSSEYGTRCSETNSQAILGQVLGDVVVASSETRVRWTRLPFPDSVQSVFSNITEGTNDLYQYNDFYVSVFSLDQELCYAGTTVTTEDQDDSGCCVAHGGNSSYVGMTWQQILDEQKITSIRGIDLHDRLIAEVDVGGQWAEYVWSGIVGDSREKRAFSSAFRDGGETYYVVVEYYMDIPPPTCDACPTGMACTDVDQYFCTPVQHVESFVDSSGFWALISILIAIPLLIVMFLWFGKKREARLAAEHEAEMNAKMDMMNEKMEVEKKSSSAAKKLVSSMFPESMQDRILAQIEEGTEDSDSSEGNFDPAFQDQAALKEKHSSAIKAKPIADLFPAATVAFGDITGFTAWSSTRDPIQVFSLLETIYSQFDKVAKQMGAFKVETVGDCYVAAVGLPEQRPDHAVVAVRFATQCLRVFRRLVMKLELDLGPGTGDLQIRWGLHSGPVTAGVLRGERGRFQLFGDTVNTAARMESTGRSNMIHLSQELVDLLLEAGKSHWVVIREDRVNCKGKGILATYFVNATASDLIYKSFNAETATETASSRGSYELENPPSASSPAQSKALSFHNKNQGLVEWNVNLMKNAIIQVVERRRASGVVPSPEEHMVQLEKEFLHNRSSVAEVKEVVHLPKFNADAAMKDVGLVELSDAVISQLRQYIHSISLMYNQNPFHNFAHATHVTMSVVKLLSRIVSPDQLKNIDKKKKPSTDSELHEDLHDYTFGITSDPMTQVAVLLSALVHDADHKGVTNAQLQKEGDPLCSIYTQSTAELNSLDLAWDLLMEDQFVDLRREIYTTEAEFIRFRELLVNIVLATDIMDKSLGALRKERWGKAFARKDSSDTYDDEDVNRKATIVLEHLIQASDVAHTMQHWHVYRKWNEAFFQECYAGYKAGRAEKNPAENWYKGEIGFFDFYIIPLAKKLKDCGVFGVSSAEYLRYAEQNRKEWETRGEAIVAELVAKYDDDSQTKLGSPSGDMAA